MNDNRYQITYDSKAQKATWRSYLNQKWRRNLIYSAVLILMGFIILGIDQVSYMKTGVRPPLTATFITFGTGVFLLLLYFLTRNMLFKRLKIVDDWSIKNPNYEVFFNETEFGCSGTFADLTCNWNSLTTYELWKDNLIVFHTGKGSSGVHISVGEIGQTDYDNLVEEIVEKMDRIKSGVD